MRLSKLNIKKINVNDIDKNYPGQDILMKLGELYQYESGIYGYGNIWTKLEKIVKSIIEEELEKVGCIETILPRLQPKELWQRSNRWDTFTKEGDIMFTSNNNLGEYGLAPTAEECATLFGANRLLSYKNLPAVYYQIGDKFRKEIRCRGYLFRTRSFVMMDAYSFDKNEEDMIKTYNLIKEAYHKIFKRLGIDVIPTISDNGAMGGKVSHEWQAKLEQGEDIIVYDEKNNIGLNDEVLYFDNRDEYLKQFGIDDVDSLKRYNTVELGHTFQLSTKYSETMNLYYKDDKGSDKPYYMACYGLGIDRIIATIIENNIIKEDGKIKGFVLPYNIAPYKVQIVYSENNKDTAQSLYNELLDNNIKAIIDDRENLGIGNRINDVLMLGTPKMIVIGNKFDSANYEIEDIKTKEKIVLAKEELIGYLTNNK